VLFLGKLDPAKGPVEFADGFLEAWRADPDRLHALVIGTGSEAGTVRARFAAAGATSALTMIDRLPHEQVMAELKRADIYVSLNRLGNLSNANLEAMQCGKAMVVPCAQPALGIDVATERLLPPESALRIAGTDDVAGLAAAILRLHRDPGERTRRGLTAAAAARTFLESWDRRIEREVELLRQVADAKLRGVATGRTPSPETL
jgi:glycosyltransferase involved in cell wall biosynthesis